MELESRLLAPPGEIARQMSGIRLYPNGVPAGLCDELIQTFRDSPDKKPSHIHNGSAPETRQGLVVMMTDTDRYRDLRQRLFGCWEQCIYDYGRKDPGLRVMVNGRFLLSHPRLEEVQPGQQFVWHMDARQNFAATRFLTVLTYLNDVAEGGETQFAMQRISVRPLRGSVLIFPPYWTHMHRGAPPKSGVKYTAGTYAMVERVIDQPDNSAFFPKDLPTEGLTGPEENS